MAPTRNDVRADRAQTRDLVMPGAVQGFPLPARRVYCPVYTVNFLGRLSAHFRMTALVTTA